jgi:hypothetical protein
MKRILGSGRDVYVRLRGANQFSVLSKSKQGESHANEKEVA